MAAMRHVMLGIYSRLPREPDLSRSQALIEAHRRDGLDLLGVCYEDEIEAMHDEMLALDGVVMVRTRTIVPGGREGVG